MKCLRRIQAISAGIILLLASPQESIIIVNISNRKKSLTFLRPQRSHLSDEVQIQVLEAFYLPAMNYQLFLLSVCSGMLNRASEAAAHSSLLTWGLMRKLMLCNLLKISPLMRATSLQGASVAWWSTSIILGRATSLLYSHLAAVQSSLIQLAFISGHYM